MIYFTAEICPGPRLKASHFLRYCFRLRSSSGAFNETANDAKKSRLRHRLPIAVWSICGERFLRLAHEPYASPIGHRRGGGPRRSRRAASCRYLHLDTARYPTTCDQVVGALGNSARARARARCRLVALRRRLFGAVFG